MFLLDLLLVLWDFGIVFGRISGTIFGGITNILIRLPTLALRHQHIHHIRKIPIDRCHLLLNQSGLLHQHLVVRPPFLIFLAMAHPEREDARFVLADVRRAFGVF